MSENKDLEDTEVIKRLLIVQLVINGVSIRNIVKITGMGTKKNMNFCQKI